MKLFLTMLSFFPYAGVGIVLAIMGYTVFNSWQAWAVFGLMFASDIISAAKATQP